MNKKYAKVQSTRRSLIMSILSLMLCFAMLIGTTYAWFTDSVTSGRNTIIAGNLDVALYHNGTDEIDENTNDLFKVAFWEPGVICYENFKVVNEGNLALKYAFTLNIYDKNTFNGRDLSEVIKVAVKDGGFNPTGTPEEKRAAAQELEGYTSLADFQKNGHLDTKTASDTYGVVLYWEPTENDNLYNVNNNQKTDDNRTELFIEFGVNLVATQYTYESDSFDNQYDKTASYELNFAKMTEKLAEDGTEDLKVKKTGIIEEAKVPAKAANDVFDDLSAQAPAEFKDGNNLKSGVNQEMVLTLDVEDKGAKDHKQTFNIDMTAVMTFTDTDSGNTETVTKNVTNLSEFVYVDVQVEKNLVLDGVKHNDKDMTKIDSPDATLPGSNDATGYYNYNSSTGILRLIMKSFSPFTMTWQELQVVTPTSTPVSATINGMGGTEYGDLWQGSFNSDTGKYETVPTTGAEAGMYHLVLNFSNLNPGDTVYLTFDEEPQNNDKESIVFATKRNVVPEGKTAKFEVAVNDQPSLSIKQTNANKVSIKVDHQELPVIVAQPTAANPMVAATGEDLHYQWCKESSTVVDNDNQKAVYAEGYTHRATTTEYKDGKWICTKEATNAAVIITLHGVSAHDIITFNAASGTGLKISLEANNQDCYSNETVASSYSAEIPETAVTGETGDVKVYVWYDKTTNPNFSGTFSIQKMNPVANGTGPKLETTEPGTYFCKVSNRVGTVISDKVTIN